MTLIDTSSWIHQMRANGDLRVRARVEALLRSGAVAWCAMVRLELWAGIGNEKERKTLREYEAVLPDLLINGVVWRAAIELAGRARRAGKTIPSSDILIFACARHHGVEIEHDDGHFDMLGSLDAAAARR